MGYFIPIDRVCALLKDNGYEFIYNPKVSLEECLNSDDNEESSSEE